MSRLSAVILLLFMLCFASPAVHAATYTVTSTDDSGPGTLREAIDLAGNGDIINFAVSGAIQLTSSELVIDTNMTIDGGAGVTIERVSGSPDFRIFAVRLGVTMTMNALTITGGTGSNGGGIYNLGTLTLNDSVIADNVTGSGGRGGGIYNENGSLTLNRSVVRDNTIPSSGGWGGGIYNGVSATFNAYNSTITGNQAINGDGGGVYTIDLASHSIINSTIANNAASTGGGIYTIGAGAANSLTNTVIANNTGGDCSGGGSATLSHSLIESGLCGGGSGNVTGVDPLLGAFSGSTHPLLPGSPALNVGDNGVCAASPINGFDQRGIARGDGACDMGSFESRGFTLTITGGNNQREQINTLFAAPLAVSVSSAFGEPVDGGSVTFDAPDSGASLSVTTPQTATISGGAASLAVTANATEGSYNVPVTAAGATTDSFALENFAYDLTVDRLDDDTSAAATACGTLPNDCTLRGAINLAQSANFPGADTITFSVTGTIPIDSTLPAINTPLIIDGPGAASLTVSGQDNVRVFQIDSGTVEIRDLTIADGRSGIWGGGIANSATLTVENVTFDGNHANGNGGGIDNGGTLTVTNSTFTGNTADGTGGGIYTNLSGALTVIDSSFSGNSGNTGGGISSDSASLMVTATTFTNNTSAQWGGAITLNASTSTNTVSRSTFTGNQALGGNGGGIDSSGGLTVTNSLFSENSATGTGGGIFVNAVGSVTVINSTIRAGTGGGGLYNEGALTVYNSISAGNAGGDCVSTGTLTIENTLVQDGSCITNGVNGNLVADPLLDSSGSPINGSPAVNAGNNARVPGGVTTDITGTNDRIQQTTVDMGAYETVFYSPSVYMQVGGVGAGEGNQTGFRLNRSATMSAPLTVNFTVTGSASLTASDYEIVDEYNNVLTSNVTIPANEGDVDVTIRILDDIMAEPEETLTLTLTAGSGYTLGFPDSISNTIVQNDLVVTNGNDSGEGSLRQAVANVQAVGGDTITFSGVTTVNLTSGELAMENTSRVTIEGGAGVAVQRVSGSPDFRIFNVGLGDVTFNHLTITGGSTSGSGGGIYAFAGALTLNNSTVSGNAASSASGGGIFTSSSVTLNNSTISGNTASVVGGGVVAQRLTLNNSTVSGNSANSEGGGVYISVMLTLNNSIIANSISGGDCRNIVTLTARYSVIEDGTCGVSGTPASPDANGNFTGDPDLNPVTLIPNPGSPVIDRGNPAGVGAPPACLATDKNGTARPIDGDGDGTARCDIGAFEVTYTPPTITLTGGAAINEGQTTTFTLTRSYATGAPLTVNLTLTPNGGLSSGDYTLRDPANANITVSAVIPANQTSVILTFTAINDGNSAEPAESLGMAVAAGTGYAVGAPSTQTATINANGLLVTNTNNSGEGSLRQAVANANTFPSDDTIPFGVSGTITLNNPSLSVDNAVTAGRLTIDGNGQSVIIAGTIAHNIIVNSGGDLTVNNLTIAGIGGGILNSGNALTINNVTFSNNTSPTLGGAIANETGTVTITNSRFNDNYGPLGGAISNDSGMVTITNSSFSGNRTATSGGAIRSGGGTVTISNSTFNENSTSDTGVTIGNSGDMSIYNSTLNGGYGGNSSASIDNSGTLRLYNSIVANTIATANCTNSGSIDVRYSLIEDGSCGVSGTPASPDANGNFTGDPDINGTTLIPDPGSPVIDRGNPATVGGGGSTCLATDKNGTARPLDGDGDTVARCDMGAFEAPATAVVTVSALDGGADETSGDNGLLRFSRVGNTSGALIVNFIPSDDAINGSDYFLSYDGVNALPGNAVTISAGQTSVDVWVTPIDDLPAEAAESLTVTLANGAYSIGVPNSASVTIAQNDYYVNTTNDGGTGSLRQAVINANDLPGIALIQFDPGVFGTEQTIGLSNPLPAINGDLEIAGPGTNLLRIAANGFRAFTVIGGTVTFHSFSIVGGGVEASGGSLTIGNSPVNISGNNTNVCGGGLLVNGASVTLQAGSQITGNTTSDNGGGVCVTAGSLTVTGGGTQVNGNIATLDGGGIYLSGGTVTVENGASVSGNTAANGGGIHQAGGNLTVTGSRIEQNTSTAGNGSAIRFADQGVRSVTNTCIVSNNDTAVTLAGGSGVVATGNWWGSSFGPFSGANAPAPNDPNTLVSTGDAVQLSLDPGIFDYSGYITTPVVGCLACVTPSGIGGGRDSRMCNFVTPP